VRRDILKQIIADQQLYAFPKDFFERDRLVDIQKFLDDPSVIILSGLRRSGKSTIQRSLQQNFLKSDCYFNFDDERLVNFQLEDFEVLMEVFIELFGKQSTFYFDEIQNIEGWERFVSRLKDQGNKVFIAGSNAKLLSKELGTHLTGRYIQFEVYPLSFKEILRHKHKELIGKKALSSIDKGLIQRLFSEYLIHGGIPDYFKYRKEEYLKDLYEGILYRDIIARYNLSSEKPLRELVYYFASNIGKEFSFSKLAELLGISSNTIKSYCSYLEQCYLCFFLNRYSHSLKKQIQYNKKCYMVDSALISKVGFRVSEDKSRFLENIVLLELKARGKEVFFHKDQKECDFIVREGSRISKAIQVSVHLGTGKIKNREIAGLVEAMNSYGLKSGFILTEAEEEIIEIDFYQIQVLPIWKWLLGSS
jgi:uncharacterized protein